jgi:hypothetical protein
MKILPKKYVLYLKSVKEPQIRLGATRRNLQAQLKIQKKMLEHEIYQQNENFLKKNYV